MKCQPTFCLFLFYFSCSFRNAASFRTCPAFWSHASWHEARNERNVRCLRDGARSIRHMGFLRGMTSLEPLTIGRRDYPLLFQTGETANGIDPFIDRQHPHDLCMELASTYSIPVNQKSSASVRTWTAEDKKTTVTNFHTRKKERKGKEWRQK